jgi:thiol-disulfide isomerase/thioredoxin
MNLILLAAFAGSSLMAQGQLDGEAVMKLVAQAAGARQSIQYVIQGTIEATQAGQPIPSLSRKGRASVVFAAPGKLRIEAQGLATAGNRVRISDGDRTWEFDAATKQYTRTSAAARLGVLGAPPLEWLGGPPGSDIQGTPRTLRDEVIEVDGQKRDCWVVTDVIRMPDPAAVRFSNTVITSWIDKELKLALRHEMSLSLAASAAPGQAMPPPADIKIVLVLSSVKMDEPVPPDTFTFAPPSDSREVQFLTPGPRVDLTGSAAPAFDVKDLEGKSYALDSLKGRRVLLDFWASWCGPCIESMPELERIESEFKDRGLVVLGVNLGEARNTVDRFLKSKPMPYPVIMGTDFGMDRAFQVTGFPTFILIGADGKIAAHQTGYSVKPGLAPMLVKGGVVAPPPAAPSPASDGIKPVAPALSRYNPAGIAVDAGGSVYIADKATSRVLKVSPEGTAVIVAGTGVPGFSGDDGPAASAQLDQPSALASDAAGNLYISDSGNGRVRKVTPDGTISTVVSQLQRAAGIAMDGSGALYVAESGGHRVRKVLPDGTASVVAGNGTPGSRGDGGAAISAQLNGPAGLAVDAQGHLYIADAGNRRVRKVTADGTILLVAGNGSAGFSGDGGMAVLAQLRNPADVAVDGAGDLYIADPSDFRIRKVTSGGTITTVAGTGIAGAEGDGGPAIRAQLGAVRNLAMDREGNLFITDAGNGSIRKLTADGTITAVAGTTAEALDGAKAH